MLCLFIEFIVVNIFNLDQENCNRILIVGCILFSLVEEEIFIQRLEVNWQRISFDFLILLQGMEVVM